MQYANYHNVNIDTDKCFVFARRYSPDTSSNDSFHRGGNALLSSETLISDTLLLIAADFSQSLESVNINLPDDMFRLWKIPYGQLNPYEQVEMKFNKYGVAILEYSL